MTDEEKKAIEFMKFYKEHCLNIENSNTKNYETVNDEEFVYKNIETVLNLIEKQDKMIDLMAKQIDEQNDILCDYDSSISYFPCNEEDSMDKCLKNECLNCIKKHFRKKVENE